MYMYDTCTCTCTCEWMCGESWLSTTPVLKAGHLGVPCYIHVHVYLSRLWLGRLPYLSLFVFCAHVHVLTHRAWV